MAVQEFLREFIKTHNKDIPNAKFSIGNKVVINHPTIEAPYEFDMVRAVSDTGDGIEYVVGFSPAYSGNQS